MLEKSRNGVFLCVSGQSKSRPVKAAGAESCGQRRNQNLHAALAKHVSFGALFDVLMSETCTRLWRKAHFEVKMHKAPHDRSTFGSSDVEKMHAAAEKSTF